jgi:glycosyltransferase involved in cell wall biosynthesis
MGQHFVLTIGPSPPPYNGMSVATDLVIKAMDSAIEHVHLDTSDRRGLSNVGKFDVGNLWLAGVHGTKFLWLLVSRRPKVVYVPISQAWLPFIRDCLFLVPAKLAGRRVIVHLHGGYFGTFFRQTSTVMRWIIRFSLGSVVSAIVLGRQVEDVFHGIVDPERVKIIPNGIPDPFQETDVTARANERQTVLFLSTLMADKGVLDLLRSLPRVAETIGSIRTVFAGEWYSDVDRREAEQLVAQLRIDLQPEFIGPVDPVRKYQLLHSSAMLVFPTFYPFEGHPYVILEAMAAGLPIISTRWACIPEMVEDGVNGFLIKPGDVATLADKICILLRDSVLREKMGRASRERFLKEFTFERFAQRMNSVFADALNNSRPGQRAQSA